MRLRAHAKRKNIDLKRNIVENGTIKKTVKQLPLLERIRSAHADELNDSLKSKTEFAYECVRMNCP